MRIESDLKNRYQDSLKMIQDCEAELSAIQDKQNQVQESLPGLEESVEKAEQAKAQSIDDFCLSKVDQKMVDLKAEASDRASRKLNSAREILEVLAQKENASQDQLSRARDSHQAIENAVWNQIYNQTYSDTQEEVTKTLHRLFAVNRRRSNSAPWESFLFNLIRKPEKEQFDELAPEIEKIFADAVRG